MIMSDRKSGRSRKTVNYKSFAFDGDEEFDDDFANSTPPVSKKRKLSTNKDNKNDKPPKLKKEETQSKPRKSVEEKLFERELQAALELSMTQSGSSSQETPVTVTTSDDGEGQKNKDIEDSGAPSPVIPTIDNPPVLPKISDLTAAGPDCEEIEVIESSVTETPRNRGNTSKKKYIDSDSEPEDFEVDLRRFLRSPLTPKVTRSRRNTHNCDNDSDFAADDDAGSGDDSTDEYDGGSDSDFGSPKKKSKDNKNNKTPAKTSTPKPAQSKSKQPKTAKSKAPAKTPSVAPSVKPAITNMVPHPAGLKPGPCIGIKSPKVSVVSPASRTPAPSLVGRKPPVWKAPGQSEPGRSPLGGVSIKSPGTGTLRIGLSRNIRLKPLHSNIKLHN